MDYAAVEDSLTFKCPRNKKFAALSGSPAVETIQLQQYFRSKNGDTYLTQFKYERFTGNFIDQPRKQTNGVVNSKFDMFKGNYFSPAVSDRKCSADYSPTPMEMDTSEENSEIDIEEHLDTAKINDEKKKDASIKKTEERKVRNTLMLLLLIFGPVIFGVLMINHFSISETIFETNHMIRDLENYIYGQQEVISKLKYSLRDTVSSNKLFVFTGGIGVGKTYTSQIILNRFPWPDNIRKLHAMNLLKNYELASELTRNLQKTGCNMIVIDDLESKHLPVVIPLVKHMIALRDYQIFIILIFNVQETSADMIPIINVVLDTKQITNKLVESDINHDVFIFNSLEEDSVKKCIQHAMKTREINIADNVVDKILRNVNFKYSGCKGVHGKVALFNGKSLKNLQCCKNQIFPVET